MWYIRQPVWNSWFRAYGLISLNSSVRRLAIDMHCLGSKEQDPPRWGGCITQKLGEQRRGECQAASCKLKSAIQQSSAAKAAYRLWRVSARQRSMALVLAIV